MFSKLSARQKMIGSVVFLAVLVVAVLGKSFYSLAHNKAEMRRLHVREARLEKEYADLSAELEKLRAKDPAVMERVARTQYDMVKKGEIQFRFSDYDQH